MTRRKGVIAVLAAAVGAMTAEAQEADRQSILTGKVKVSEFSSKVSGVNLRLIDEARDGDYGFTHITVQYGDRAVTLTAKEIMEALEGK